MQKTAIVIALVLCAASRASSQQPTREPMCVIDGVPRPGIQCGPGRPDGDPLARYLFPPELVMANQQAIGLTDRQRSSLQEAMKDAQGKFIDLQFRMSGEVENLRRLIEPASVDEARVLAQVDRVLAAEREVKHAQLSLMIRIKNLLTLQQQAQLGALRRQGGGE
ncbi:MAG: periplasmic heavy metal sensor [Gemmatimonadaceae bacterium]